MQPDKQNLLHYLDQEQLRIKLEHLRAQPNHRQQNEQELRTEQQQHLLAERERRWAQQTSTLVRNYYVRDDTWISEVRALCIEAGVHNPTPERYAEPLPTRLVDAYAEHSGLLRSDAQRALDEALDQDPEEWEYRHAPLRGQWWLGKWFPELRQPLSEEGISRW